MDVFLGLLAIGRVVSPAPALLNAGKGKMLPCERKTRIMPEQIATDKSQMDDLQKKVDDLNMRLLAGQSSHAADDGYFRQR